MVAAWKSQALGLLLLLLLGVASALTSDHAERGIVSGTAAEADADRNSTLTVARQGMSRSMRSVRHRHREYVAPTAEEEAVVDAHNAAQAEDSAHSAADVATNVATHSIHVTEHAQSALRHAHEALHNARVDAEGLSKDQRDLLKTAETKLRTATQAANYGKVEQARYDMRKLHDKLGTDTTYTGEVQSMRDEVQGLRSELRHSRDTRAASQDDASADALDQQMSDLDASMQTMENDEVAGRTSSGSHDELKSEIERLRETVHRYEEVTTQQGGGARMQRAEVESSAPDPPSVGAAPRSSEVEPEAAPSAGVEADAGSKRIDIDTEMPYGELEPFGREDTAQELTESSIRESDEMVDQLERAEVAEEKRSVFRALTRLRGAAITSFDGVARAQTGNIDEYNKVHKWRKTHPLHHLADEESDISKWAFPDNADF